MCNNAVRLYEKLVEEIHALYGAMVENPF